MKKIKLATALLTIGLFTFSSCSERLVDFTVISTKNVSLKINKGQGKQVKGSDFGPFGIGANIKDAMDKALQSAGPDYDLLVDGVVRVHVYPFVSGYKVEGIAVSTNKMQSALGKEGFDEWCKAHNIMNPNTVEVTAE